MGVGAGAGFGQKSPLVPWKCPRQVATSKQLSLITLHQLSRPLSPLNPPETRRYFCGVLLQVVIMVDSAGVYVIRQSLPALSHVTLTAVGRLQLSKA